MAGVELLVQQGSEISTKEPFARVVTNAAGNYEVDLPAGVWCVYFASRRLTGPQPELGPEVAPEVDAEAWRQRCLQGLRVQCDATFRTPDVGGSRIDLAVFNTCPQPFNQPCYYGPYPP